MDAKTDHTTHCQYASLELNYAKVKPVHARSRQVVLSYNWGWPLTPSIVTAKKNKGVCIRVVKIVPGCRGYDCVSQCKIGLQ